MRIYLPATVLELDDLRPGRGGTTTLDLAPRRAHAVTAELTAAYPDDDEESLEYSAHLAAADDTLALIAADPSAPRLRLVLSVEVPDAVVVVAGGDVTVVAPSAVDVVEAVTAVVVCAHVDEDDARADVDATLAGDDDAVERLVDRDLLWYDASELGGLARRLLVQG